MTKDSRSVFQVKHGFCLLLYSLVITACLANQVTKTAPAVTASGSALLPSTLTSTPIAIFLEEEDKRAYVVSDIGNSSSSDFPEFWEEYELALRQGAAWVHNPLQVALRFLHPSAKAGEPGCRNEEVAYIPTDEDSKAIFIFVYSQCGDDSLGKIKRRIELSQQDNVWKIDWYGGMKKCRRGSDEFKEVWHTKTCP